ncbi:hypothetical protein AAF712_011135 [Marasmius tenuissimus]|uniref:Protein kinase domain-containing protein n=1 Tax=Marasmius tenuissimus TaxID=585030 RepID=A0ABR2ZJZ7_9AGAR
MSSIQSWISAKFASTLTLSRNSQQASDNGNLQSSTGDLPNVPIDLPENSNAVGTQSSSTYDGRISSFVFLVSGLERTLNDTPILIDRLGTTFTEREPVASGASFSVERAVWVSNPTNQKSVADTAQRWGKYVALKYAHVHQSREETTRWKHILLEIRALLHEPIRYHPNIVRLLGLSWGAARLQLNEEPLLFETKKKLCYDVSKGISILHACGIVHGDLKHENVLVFPNSDQNSDVLYTAKLADFGGSVMDLDAEGSSLHMGTPPYDAPEAKERSLTAEGMKKTDRTLLNGDNPFEWLSKELGANDEELLAFKHTDELLRYAKETVWRYEGIEEEKLLAMEYALENSLQAMPDKRQLYDAIAGLQVDKHSEIQPLLDMVAEENAEYDLEESQSAPVRCQTPGYKPFISSPDPAEFLFEPEKLRFILDWDVQVAIVKDPEQAAVAMPGQITTQINNATAAFYLFKCHCHEFGVPAFEPKQACYWLRMAASSEEDCQESYLAKAWCWRVHRALGVPLEVDMTTLNKWMMHSITRGHIKCIAEARSIGETITDFRERNIWEGDIDRHVLYLRLGAAGIGMPYFLSHNFPKQWSFSNFRKLNQSIQEELEEKGIETIDEIYVNHKGHGLLHYAASVGNLKAFRYLVEVHSSDINIANQHASETPLLSSPDGSDWAAETPLYWLCAFEEKEIPTIAQRLAWVDYEDLFCLPVSPLSRAVIMENLPAVRTLLALGADPLERIESRSSVCPIVMAAVLMLPDVLEVLLQYLDSRSEDMPVRIFDELETVRIALDMQATMQDPSALLNRITRCAADAQVALDRTLRMLHEREAMLKSPDEAERPAEDPSSANNVISRLVQLGRRDIIRSLLELGHRTFTIAITVPNPVVEAVEKNDEHVFRLLDDFNVKLPQALPGPLPNLLYHLAERPASSQPGLYIAGYLLDIMGLSVEDFLSDRVTPFASAVTNLYFDLANLLLERGADIDQHNAKPTLLTSIVVDNLSERGCASVRWLLNLDEENQPLATTDKSRSRADLVPRFITGTAQHQEWTILHTLAISRPRTDTSKRASSRITAMILSIDTYRENLDYIVPGVGPPLLLATLMNNLEVDTELLGRGANANENGGWPSSSKEILEQILAPYPYLREDLRSALGIPEDDRALEMLVWKRYMLIWELMNAGS